MPIRFSGGCACGAIRYECTAEPIMALNCHCRDCQRATGTAYASAIFVPAPAVTIAKGNLKYHVVTGESGNRVSRGFCPDCGSPVLAKSADYPAFVIFASSLDDPSWHRPTMNVWTSSAQPWDVLDPALPQHPKGLQG
jgi:hypothetical protein